MVECGSRCGITEGIRFYLPNSTYTLLRIEKRKKNAANIQQQQQKKENERNQTQL